MAVEVNEITKFLNDLGARFRVVEHRAVFTASEGFVELGGKQPVKNLLLTNNKGRVILVALFGDKRLNLKKLALELGSGHLSFASSEELRKYLGLEPGSVSIFGLLNPGSESVELIIDRELTMIGEVGWHPNQNTKTVFINSNDVEKVAAALTSNCKIVQL